MIFKIYFNNINKVTLVDLWVSHLISYPLSYDIHKSLHKIFESPSFDLVL